MELGFKKQVKINADEYWFGGAVTKGKMMPLTESSEFSFDSRANRTSNPLCGNFISSDGRYIRTGADNVCEVKDGVLTIESTTEIDYAEGFETLKGAYLALANKYFQKDEIKVPRVQLLQPQFCTWTEMDVNVTEEKIIAFAESIVEKGLPHGVFIIDDGWMTEYGEWTFSEKKFKNPAKMISRLKELGFVVEVWLVPYVRKTAKDYAYLLENNVLIRNADGSVFDTVWWNGTDNLLDMTNPIAIEWLKGQIDALLSLGVDGFKFDGGAGYHYKDETLKMYEKRSANGYSNAYAEFAIGYEHSEVRDYVELNGLHITTRLCDKRRSFTRENGLGQLVPDMIQAGLCGYPYTCADMIGGGSNTDFAVECEKSFDYELASRSCECSAMFPAMQFSFAYWNRNDAITAVFKKYTALHSELNDYLNRLIDEAEENFAPIVRAVEYEFPHQGMAIYTDEFMLGEDYLVAPVTEEGKTIQTVVLPSGVKWLYVPSGKVYDGGQTVEVDAPIDVLPYFKKTI